MLRILALLLIAANLAAQTPTSPELERLRRRLQDAIRDKDLSTAADIAAKLDDAVQRKFRASLIHDASDRVNDVLTWLPSDTETLLVYQEPFVISAEDSPAMFYGRPARLYATDRLMALNEGQLYRQLQGRTVRLLAAGLRNMRSRGVGVPSLMPEADVAYFYFFAEPLDPDLLGVPELSVEKQSLWRRTAKIDVNGPLKAGVRERSQREDETWLALPRPDLLVAASSRDFQIEILGRIARGPSTRALPSSLPEWPQVDRKAGFWGLRHYSDPEARHDNSNPRGKDSEAAQSDAKALGATVQFDMDNNVVEVRYLSGNGHLPGFIESMVEHEFQVDRAQADIWRLKSNLRDRGDFPFHFADYLLGFGGYR